MHHDILDIIHASGGLDNKQSAHWSLCANTHSGCVALLLVATVGAEDVSSLGHELLVGQTQGASLTVEAVLVPGAALVVHHVHSFTETCDGVLAAAAFLGH